MSKQPMESTHAPQPTRSDSMLVMVNGGSPPSKTDYGMSIGRSLHENLILTSLTNLHHHKSSFSIGIRLSAIRFGPYLMRSGKIAYRSQHIWHGLTKSGKFQPHMLFLDSERYTKKPKSPKPTLLLGWLSQVWVGHKLDPIQLVDNHKCICF